MGRKAFTLIELLVVIAIIAILAAIIFPVFARARARVLGAGSPACAGGGGSRPRRIPERRATSARTDRARNHSPLE